MHYRIKNKDIHSDLMCSSTARQNGGKTVSKIRGRTNLTADEVHKKSNCTSKLIFVE